MEDSCGSMALDGLDYLIHWQDGDEGWNNLHLENMEGNEVGSWYTVRVPAIWWIHGFFPRRKNCCMLAIKKWIMVSQPGILCTTKALRAFLLYFQTPAPPPHSAPRGELLLEEAAVLAGSLSRSLALSLDEEEEAEGLPQLPVLCSALAAVA
jgi:hypothetical protein